MTEVAELPLSDAYFKAKRTIPNNIKLFNIPGYYSRRKMEEVARFPES